MFLRVLLCQLLGLLDHFLDGADHVEGLLGQGIVLACKDKEHRCHEYNMLQQPTSRVDTRPTRSVVLLKLTAKDALEALDGLLEGHQFAHVAGEDLGHLEGLGQETLDLTGAGDGQFVLLRQLVHTQDGNDVLQGLVVLRKKRKALVQSSS